MSPYNNVKFITTIICFSLFFSGQAALAVVVYRAEADLRKVFLERGATNYWRWAIIGYVNFFIGLFVVTVGLYVNSCSNFWAMKMGIIHTTADKNDDTNCSATGAVLSGIGWLGSMLYAFGRSHLWFIDNRALAGQAPEMKRRILTHVAIILTYSVTCLFIYQSSTTEQLIQNLFGMKFCSTTI